MIEANEIHKLFHSQQISLGAAESFTGGLFAREITAIPGASNFFKGSIVTYATEEKNRLLGISYDDINKYGVVSEEIASLMASNARQLLNVDYCVSFTGNAGPIPMENKPVGEVYIGIATPNGTEVFKLLLNGDRETIQKEGVRNALYILRQIILKNN